MRAQKIAEPRDLLSRGPRHSLADWSNLGQLAVAQPDIGRGGVGPSLLRRLHARNGAAGNGGGSSFARWGGRCVMLRQEGCIAQRSDVRTAGLPKLIHPARLKLRGPGRTAVDDSLTLVRDPEFARCIDAPQHEAREAAEAWTEQHLRQDWGTRPTHVIEHGGRVIGQVRLTIELDGRRAELGATIGRGHWRKGFGTEACQSVIAAAFRRKKPERIYVQIPGHNPASVRMVENWECAARASCVAIIFSTARWRTWPTVRFFTTSGGRPDADLYRRIALPSLGEREKVAGNALIDACGQDGTASCAPFTPPSPGGRERCA